MNTRAWPMMICSLAALALPSAGCQRGDGAMTEERFCEEYARIECGKVAAFCSFNAANCEPIRFSACKMNAAQLKGGGHEFNPGNTDGCLKKLGEAYQSLPITATKLKEVDDSCARVFEGTARALERCVADYDCTGGLICDKGLCGAEKIVGAGAQCADIGARCPRGEYCTNDNPVGVFLCTRRLDQGSACSISQPCNETFRCRNTCVPRLDIQGACESDDDCISGYCNRYVNRRTCGVGLTFSPESPSCVAYMTGDPARSPTLPADGSVD